MKHTPKQLKCLWACLNDLSAQVQWHGQWLTKDDWKLVCSASLKGELRMVPSLDEKTIVVLGHSIKEMEQTDMADLITLVVLFGDKRGVRWKNPADILNAKEHDHR